MTLEELENGLPSGLHDASLESFEVDWSARKVRLTVRLSIDEETMSERRARIVITGLVYAAIDPPNDRMDPVKEGMWIDAGPGLAPGREQQFSPVPNGCFVHWIYLSEWNSFAHVCGRDVTLEWLD